MKMKREQIDLGYIDIPKEYFNFTARQKKAVCNKLIDTLLKVLDKELDPTINRFTFLDEIFESSIETNNEVEQYEVSAVLNDCRKQLNIG